MSKLNQGLTKEQWASVYSKEIELSVSSKGSIVAMRSGYEGGVGRTPRLAIEDMKSL